jgi:PAS domain S-box-containing protein
MTNPLRVLCCEDSERDALLLERHLRKEWPGVATMRVDTPDAMGNALEAGDWDVVLSDQSMPAFSAGEALRILQEHHLDIPFIVVSGVLRTEDAVDLMRAGAHDFVRKDDPARLIPAIRREMEQAASRAQRRKVETAFWKAEARYRSIVEDNPDLICRWLPDGTLTYVNRAYRDFFGMGSEELLGKPFFPLIPPEDQESVKANVAGLSCANPVLTHEHRVITPDGEIRWQRWTDHAICDHAGNILEFQGSGHDTTQERLDRIRLAQADKMEALGNLAGGIAHDFNNMLLPILTLARMTLDDLPEGHRGRLRLQKVVEAAERARDLAARILAFGHKEDDAKPEPLDLARLVRETLGLLRSTLPSTIEFRGAVEDLPGHVTGDRSQIASALMNLVGNAADALGGQVGWIEVTLSPEEIGSGDGFVLPPRGPGPHAHLVVRDSGKGMDEETKERIFLPFFTTKEVGQGTGLGLAMVHGMMTRMGGGIRVESAPGRGTAFDLFFPMERWA